MTDFDTLAGTSTDELLRVANLIEAGLLTFPPDALALRDHVSQKQVANLAECLAKLARQDMRSEQVALLLRAYAAGRKSTDHVIQPIEIVVSGPDVAGGARDTGVVMRQLFGIAQKRVLAVGFAVHQGKAVFKTLADRLDNDDAFDAVLCIDIRRQPGDTSLEREILLRFANQFANEEWPGKRLPRVYYDPRSLQSNGWTVSSMHAKCVVADGQQALVTSANFTEAAQERNIELGLLIDANTIAGRIEGHFNSLIDSGFLAPLPLPANQDSL